MDRRRLVAALRKLIRVESKVYKDTVKNTILYYTDDFIDGHCHEFAIALHRLFGNKLGLIKGVSTNNNQKLLHLFHAVSINKNGDAYDVNGRYDVKQAMEGFKNQFNPDKISFNVYKTEQEMAKKLWTIPIEEKWIKKGIKRIVKDPDRFFDYRLFDKAIKNYKTIEYPEILTLNPSLNPHEDKYEKAIRDEQIIKSHLSTYTGWHLAEPYLHFDMQYNESGEYDPKTSGLSAKLKTEIHYSGYLISTGMDIISFKIEYKDIDDNEAIKTAKKFYKVLGEFVADKTPSIIKSILSDVQ